MRIYSKNNREKLNNYNRLRREKIKESTNICNICDGHYLAHHKKRHEESKKHIAATNLILPLDSETPS